MSDIDQIIEELENEVLAEADNQDKPKKGAVAAEKEDTLAKGKDAAEDLGDAVVDPEQKDGPGDKASKKAKEVKGDAQTKSAKAGDKKSEKLKETFSDDLNALVLGEDNLSEDFQKKAATIFEAAISSKLRAEVERLEEEVQSKVEEEKGNIVEKVDTFLNYVVEEWMEDNKLATENGLKTEIAEDFISGLKTLFEQHYIDVPSEKYDVLGLQEQKLKDLEAKLNEQIETNASQNARISTLMRESILMDVASDLSDTQKDKFKGLIEDVEFVSESDYTDKLNTLKESYFPSEKVVTESIDSESDEEVKVNYTDDMNNYMSAISSNVKRSK
jgi:hypothetical protein